MLKKLLLAALSAIALLALVLVAKTAATPSRQLQVQPAQPLADSAGAARRLGEAVRFATISNPAQRDPAQFEGFRDWLVTAYPKAHAALEREVLGEALLYTWPGSDASLAPILLVAHYDVVPVEEETLSAWTHPPFSGLVRDGAVWGRGTLDDKNAVIGIMEAVEGLLAQGYAPKRGVILAFGDDEEFASVGAKAIVAKLEQRGVKALFALDEGLVIADGIVKGLAPPAALIGVSERGFVNVEIVARSEGGHSSVPPAQTAVGVVSAAVAKLEASPFPARLDGPARMMLEWLGPEMGGPNRLVMANLWLLDGVVTGVLTSKQTTNASVRTTQAATLFTGGVKANVLPQEAIATVNVRVHPRDSIASALERMRWVINDPRVEVRIAEDGANRSEPSPVSSTESAGFKVVAQSVREAFPEAVVAPALVSGYTDGRLYTGLAEDVYRVGAFRATGEDVARIHGTDERIRVDDLSRAVVFFRQVIVNADAAR